LFVKFENVHVQCLGLQLVPREHGSDFDGPELAGCLYKLVSQIEQTENFRTSKLFWDSYYAGFF